MLCYCRLLALQVGVYGASLFMYARANSLLGIARFKSKHLHQTKYRSFFLINVYLDSSKRAKEIRPSFGYIQEVHINRIGKLLSATR